MNTKYIVSIGEILFDADPKKGLLTIGGAPSNWAIDCHRLISNKNIKTVVVSAIGDDLLGDVVEDFLDNCNIGSLIARLPNQRTSVVKVKYDEANNPSYDIVEPVAWDFIGFDNASPEQKALLDDIRANCCAVCWGTLGQRKPVSRKFIQDFVSSITNPNALKVYDPNIRKKPDDDKEIIRKSLLLANTVKLSHEEVDTIGDLFDLFQQINTKTGENKGTEEDYKERSKILFDAFPNLNMIIITLSDKGSYIFTRNGEMSKKEHIDKVENAKPVGCGDSFLAGVIASLVSGKDLPYAHQKGTEVSRFVAQNDSATPKLPRKFIID